jgi:L-arabinonolactonase
MSQTAPSITLVGETRDRLGESPIWDAREQALYWVDSIAPCIRRLHPATSEMRHWVMPMDIGSIGLSRPGHLLAGLRDGFFDVDLAAGSVAPLHRLDLPPGLRLNDGKMDRHGRYITGTLATAAAGPNPPPGSLYRLWPDGRCEVLDHGITVANAICFSPAGDWLYFADSLQGIIWRYPYNSASGAVGAREDFIDVRKQTGSSPDGATVDSEGRVWVALVQTGQLGCFSRTGSLLQTINLSVELPSCPAFGGAGLDQIFVTSISNSGRLHSDKPDAGALLRLAGTGAVGIAEARFGGDHTEL